MVRNLVAIGRAGLLNYTQADFGSTVPYGGPKTNKRNQVVPFTAHFKDVSEESAEYGLKLSRRTACFGAIIGTLAVYSKLLVFN